MHTDLYLLGRAAHDDIAARVRRALLLVALIHEGTPQVDTAEPLRQVAADYLHGTRHGHELAPLAIRRLSEIDVHQFLLQARRLSSFVSLICLQSYCLPFTLLCAKIRRRSDSYCLRRHYA